MACFMETEEVHHDQLESSKGDDDEGMDVCDRADEWFGCYLVRRVYDDLVELSEKDKVGAWGANRVVIQDQVVEHAEEQNNERSGKPETEWTIEKKCENTRKKNAIMIQPVKADPKMNYWVKTPVNIPTPDSKFLSHIPFLGDDHEKHDKKGVFTEKLFENFGWNLHDDQAFDDVPVQSEVTVDLIRVLMKVGKRYSDDIFCSKPNPSIDKPSQAELVDICTKVRHADKTSYAQRKPTPKLLAAVSEAFEGVKPSVLKARYVQLSKRRNPSFESSVKDAPNNVDDGTDTKVRSKKTQMDSYGSLFCRLCYKFSCIQHVLLNSEEITSMKAVAKLQRIENEKFKKPLVKTGPQETIKCTFQDCQKEMATDQLPDKRHLKKRWRRLLTESKWTPTDQTMFNCFYDSYKDYCIIATMLNNKTCVEVMNYHRLHELMKEDGQIQSSSKSKVDEPACSSSNSKVIASDNDSFNSSTSSGSEEDVPDNIAELYTYAPCCHSDGICDESCLCVAGKKFCETPCGCLKSCKNRFKGCVCTTTCDSKRCPCYCANRECDPDLCQRCCSHEIDIKKVRCKNVSIQRKLKSPIELKPSPVSGWGAFASTDLKKGDFIGEYTAELISDNEADRRGHIYDEKDHTYLFNLVKDQLALDAARFGSECRFINSSTKPNCQVRNTTVRGENHLAIVTLKDIEKDSELFINYHQALDYCKMKKKLKQMNTNKKYIDKP